MTNREQYLAGVHSFVAEPNDNPDCIPFYAAWRGMQNVIGKETLSRWHHLFHEAIGWGAHVPVLEQYAVIIKHAQFMCDRGGRTEEPRYSYSYECAPSEPTDEDARKFFNEEFKRAYPGKRANSKEANRLWEEKRSQAIAILGERYQASLLQFNEREAKRDAENARRKQEWIESAWALAQFEDVVRGLVAQVETGA